VTTDLQSALTSGYPSLDAVAAPAPGIFDLRVAACGHGKSSDAVTAVISLARAGIVGYCHVEEDTALMISRMGLGSGGEHTELADSVVVTKTTSDVELARMYLTCFARAAAADARVAGIVVDYVDLFDSCYDAQPTCTVMSLLRAFADGDIDHVERLTGIDVTAYLGPGVDIYPVAVIAYGQLLNGHRDIDDTGRLIEPMRDAIRITRTPNQKADRVTELRRDRPFQLRRGDGRLESPEGRFIVFRDGQAPVSIPMLFDANAEGTRAVWSDPAA
jgi:hypothetical protein